MHTIDSEFIKSLRKDVSDFLFNLVASPSIAGHELPACDYCYSMFAKIPGIKLFKQVLDNSIMDNPLWCCGPYDHPGYKGQYNIEAVWEGTGGQDPVYFNAHIDTVTPCDPHLLDTRIEGDTLYGLGAMDDKGPIGTMFAMLLYLSYKNIRFPFDIVMHVVLEEEIGGNGSLAITDRPLKGQAAVVLDGGEGVVAYAHRNSMWLRVTCKGESAHPGSFQKIGRPKSSYDLLGKALSIIEELHKIYLAECRENPVRYFENMVPPFNLGMVEAGNWPTTVPTESSACMLFGVLPNCTNEQMLERIKGVLDADPELKGKYSVKLIFSRPASVTEPDHPIVTNMQKCMRAKGFSGEPRVLNCVTDMLFYTNILKLPAVTVGIGSGTYPHSKDEQISLTGVIDLAEAMLNWLGTFEK